MKKADIKLILIVGVVCIALLLWRAFFQKEGAFVLIEVNGETYGTYSLNQDQTISVNDTNVVKIENGEVYMSEASCPDGLCISQGHISASGTMIVCLPNRVVVQIIDEEETADGENDGIDAVTG